jgi:hypothetical protein
MSQQNQGSQKGKPKAQQSNGKPTKSQNTSQQNKQGLNQAKKESSQNLKESEEKQRTDKLQQIYNNYVFPWNVRPNFMTFLSLPFIRDLKLSQLVTGNPLNEMNGDELLQKDLDSWRIQATNRARDLIGRFQDRQSMSSMGTRQIDQGVRESDRDADLHIYTKHLSQSNGIPLLKKKARVTVRDVEPIEERQERSDGLEPESRVTAWFMCRSCPYLEPDYEKLGALDFAGICAHQCHMPYNAASTSVEWNICEW